MLVKEGRKCYQFGRGKATVVWGCFIHEEGLLLEVTVQEEGAFGRQTKRGTRALQKKIEYEHKHRGIKALLRWQ